MPLDHCICNLSREKKQEQEKSEILYCLTLYGKPVSPQMSKAEAKWKLENLWFVKGLQMSPAKE